MGLRANLAYLWAHPLGRQQRVATLWRWAAWQARCRLSRGPHVRPWIAGTRLVVERGMTGATGNLYVGLHEFDEMAFALHLLRPGDLFVDVGANVGSYSVLAAGACGADVVAFEPLARARASLLANLAANGLESRVQVLAKAVGSAQGVLRMTAGLDTANHVLRPGDDMASTVQVPVTTLDAELAGRAPALVKIDVEGHDAEVLAGASVVLSNTQAVVVELGHAATADRLVQAGFSACAYDGLTRSLSVLARPTANRAGNAWFVRDVAWARARCTAAPRMPILGVSL